MLEQAIADDNRHPEAYILNANISFNEGRITDAILNLQMALGLASETRWDADQKKRFAKEARTGLIHSFETRGDFPSAREYATELLNADPKDGAVRARLASVIFRLDNPAEAEKELVQAFADDPKLDPPELQLAALWQARANSEADAPKQIVLLGKVEEWLKKAVANHSKNPKCFREYAVWLLHDGKVDAAGLYIEALGKLDSASKESLFAKGLYLLHKKDFAGAEPSHSQGVAGGSKKVESPFSSSEMPIMPFSSPPTRSRSSRSRNKAALTRSSLPTSRRLSVPSIPRSGRKCGPRLPTSRNGPSAFSRAPYR